jgi:hypothetical protein
MISKTLRRSEGAEWDAMLDAVGDSDVFHTLHHLNVILEEGEAPRLFYYGNETDYVIYPYLKRPVNDLEFIDDGDLDETYYDVITGEYAGPLCRAESLEREQLLAEFREEFRRHCGEHNIVSEFGRLHPFINSEEPFVGILDAQSSKDVVYVDLRKDEDQIFNEMDKSKQKQVTEARETLSVETTRDWRTFKEMYDATMDRADAGDRYRYDEEFFETLFSEHASNSVLFIACHDGQPVSGLIALTGDRFVHTYLSGSFEEYLDLNGNVLLKYETIEYGLNTGREICNFGGGVDGSDGVFRFKQEFSETTTPFLTYRHIHDEDAYETLNTLKEAAIGPKAFESVGFFPRYRGPS